MHTRIKVSEASLNADRRLAERASRVWRLRVDKDHASRDRIETR
jgi:hypothetical protein